ncbi:unnamed protein product [Calypogeia fissa]
MGTIDRSRLLLLAAVTLLISINGVYGGKFNEARVGDLLSRRAQSKDGVIRLDDDSLKRFAIPAPEPRPYSLIIFFDALQLRDNAELKLEALRGEYGLVATAYAKANPDSGRVFFTDLEFAKSQSSFQAFGVSTLPSIKHLGPGNVSLAEADSMEQGDMFRSADGMVSFVEAKTRQKVGAIERPPAFSKKQLIVLIGGLLVASPFVIKRIMAKDTIMHDPRFWCFNAVLVYFFSVSGGMHNIIRGMPFFTKDRENPGKLQFFYPGSGMQLGAEGFVVGSLYTLVGLLLAFVTHLLYEIRSKTAQRFFLVVVMGISFIAVRKVVTLDNWKTGYHVHGYWPNRWR